MTPPPYDEEVDAILTCLVGAATLYAKYGNEVAGRSIEAYIAQCKALVLRAQIAKLEFALGATGGQNIWIKDELAALQQQLKEVERKDK